MLDRNLQHPEISAIERTGYPLPRNPDSSVVCAACGYTVTGRGAEFDGNVLCSECLEAEFNSLTKQEQHEAMAAACGRVLRCHG